MPLRADNSNIPRGNDNAGNPPDPTPRFGMALADAWYELDRAEPHEKSRTDVERYVRLGWGGKCARDIGYRLLDVEPSNPPDIAGIWRMSLGTMVHEGLQDALVKSFPGAEIEKVVGAEHDEIMGIPTSGRTDVFLVTHDACSECDHPTADHDKNGCWVCPNNARCMIQYPENVPPKRIAIEVKTINGFGFKMAVGARGTAEGPRSGAIFQAALNGRALQADEVVVIYLSLECLSDRELDSLVKKTGGEAAPHRKFLAEWTWSMGALDELVDRELKRLGKIIEMVDTYALDNNGDGEVMGAPLPPRSIPLEMPAKGRVVDPSKGTWQVEVEGNVMDAGTVWFCNYCDYQKRCIADGPS